MTRNSLVLQILLQDQDWRLDGRAAVTILGFDKTVHGLVDEVSRIQTNASDPHLTRPE